MKDIYDKEFTFIKNSEGYQVGLTFYSRNATWELFIKSDKASQIKEKLVERNLSGIEQKEETKLVMKLPKKEEKDEITFIGGYVPLEYDELIEKLDRVVGNIVEELTENKQEIKEEN